jgi:FkbM family methyltransferase
VLKSVVKRTIRHLGFDLQRYSPSTSEGARFMATLSAHNVNLVFDIGANIGQFGRLLRDLGYSGRIVSFEPVSAAWNQLAETSRGDALWEVAARAAIGGEDGEIEMHVAGNSVSSSALNMLDAHVKAAPQSSYVRSERLPLRRLDTIGADFVRTDSILFLKIDTQGFEAQVLKGAPELLQRAVGLHMELSLIPLYEGQCIYDEMIGQLKALGFELWGVMPGFTDPQNGRLLQVDATFFRN